MFLDLYLHDKAERGSAFIMKDGIIFAAKAAEICSNKRKFILKYLKNNSLLQSFHTNLEINERMGIFRVVNWQLSRLKVQSYIVNFYFFNHKFFCPSQITFCFN